MTPPIDFEALKFALRTLAPLTWVTTFDAPKWLTAIGTVPGARKSAWNVYQPYGTNGVCSVTSYPGAPSQKTSTGAEDVLERLLVPEKPTAEISLIVLPHVLITDRLLNILRRLQDKRTTNSKWVHLTVFLNPDAPPAGIMALSPEVIKDRGPSIEEVREQLAEVAANLQIPLNDEGLLEVARGLSHFQIDQLLCKTFIMHKTTVGSRGFDIGQARILRAKMKGVYE